MMILHFIARRFAVFVVFLTAFVITAAATSSFAAQGESGTAHDGVATHALRVERRAAASSFSQLEDFGRAALQRNDAEGLSRLQHVTWIWINQDEFEAATRWNTALKTAARAQNNARYLAIAEVNEQQIVHFRDHSLPLEQMQALADRQTDWLARALAQTGVARRLIDEQRVSDALKLMAEVIPTIPAGQAAVGSVAAVAWDRVSIAHMMVDDVPGYLKAIGRAEDHMAASAYPRPDYDSLYNLAQSLGFLGRHDEALALVQAYVRLAARTGTATATAYAGNLCAYAATARDDWPSVLECLAPFGPDLEAPEVVSNIMLPQRAAGYARTGQVAEAQRDVAEIDRRVAAGRMTAGGAVERARAELLIAQGSYAQGVDALRQYHLKRFLRASTAAAAAMEQVVVGIDEQLTAATAQNALRLKVINTQRWLIALSIALALGAALMFWCQRQLSAKLADAGRRLQDAFENKSAFFANMSHEIRTPLNGVVAMADALGRMSLSDQASHMVRIISASGATLERLLSDLLDSAKMEAGQLEVEVVAFDLGDTVLGVQGLWTEAAHKKGVSIEVHLDPAANRWAMGDRVRLSQVLNNLVSNALKFTTEGSVCLTAEGLAEDRVRFMISDTGVGFDEKQRLKIFERFQQADESINRRFGGTGLGLSICRQIVELMGGQLDCASTPGVGSRFWFEITLPATSREDEAAPLADTLEPEAERPLKILVVDDNSANRSILTMLLEDDATDLQFAENGEEAVAAVDQAAFDVILMDMEMPVMDGLQATREIRTREARDGSVPCTIVMFSGNDSAEHRERGRAAGANGHITKPVTLERLLDGINLAMSQNRTPT